MCRSIESPSTSFSHIWQNNDLKWWQKRELRLWHDERDESELAFLCTENGEKISYHFHFLVEDRKYFRIHIVCRFISNELPPSHTVYLSFGACVVCWNSGHIQSKLERIRSPRICDMRVFDSLSASNSLQSTHIASLVSTLPHAEHNVERFDQKLFHASVFCIILLLPHTQAGVVSNVHIRWE